MSEAVNVRTRLDIRSVPSEASVCRLGLKLRKEEGPYIPVNFGRCLHASSTIRRIQIRLSTDSVLIAVKFALHS